MLSKLSKQSNFSKLKWWARTHIFPRTMMFTFPVGITLALGIGGPASALFAGLVINAIIYSIPLAVITLAFWALGSASIALPGEIERKAKKVKEERGGFSKAHLAWLASETGLKEESLNVGLARSLKFVSDIHSLAGSNTSHFNESLLFADQTLQWVIDSSLEVQAVTLKLEEYKAKSSKNNIKVRAFESNIYTAQREVLESIRKLEATRDTVASLSLSEEFPQMIQLAKAPDYSKVLQEANMLRSALEHVDKSNQFSELMK